METLTRVWVLALAHPMYSVPLALVALVLLASAINRALPPGPPKTFVTKLIDRLAVLVRRGAINGPWSWPLLGYSLFEAVRDSARDAWGPPDDPPPNSPAGFVAAPVLRFVATLAVLVTLPLALSRCAATPHLTAVTPRIVQRPEYGTCLEVGGKVTVAGHGVLTQLSSTCWESVMDAGARDAGVDASAPEPEAEAVEGKGDGGGL